MGHEWPIGYRCSYVHIYRFSPFTFCFANGLLRDVQSTLFLVGMVQPWVEPSSYQLIHSIFRNVVVFDVLKLQHGSNMTIPVPSAHQGSLSRRRDRSCDADMCRWRD